MGVSRLDAVLKIATTKRKEDPVTLTALCRLCGVPVRDPIIDPCPEIGLDVYVLRCRWCGAVFDVPSPLSAIVLSKRCDN
jgi:hypothetical protein